MFFKIITTTFAQHQTGIQQVRRQVFIDEQGIDPDLEWDSYDATATFAVALDEQQHVIGTARLLSSGKIGRMAVLPAYRRQGIGSALLQHLLAVSKQHGYRRVILAAQQNVTGFYQKHGFTPVGPGHVEAGIPHQNMHRIL